MQCERICVCAAAAQVGLRTLNPVPWGKMRFKYPELPLTSPVTGLVAVDANFTLPEPEYDDNGDYIPRKPRPRPKVPKDGAPRPAPTAHPQHLHRICVREGAILSSALLLPRCHSFA